MSRLKGELKNQQPEESLSSGSFAEGKTVGVVENRKKKVQGFVGGKKTLHETIGEGGTNHL